jgi:glycosyltransferase involved in cell wall biosynthesis
VIAASAVSVILPKYNRAHLLLRSIASVLGQSWRNFELIVVDGGSISDTEQVVRKTDVFCGHSVTGIRTVLNAIQVYLTRIFSWIILLSSPFGAPLVQYPIGFSQRAKHALP